MIDDVEIWSGKGRADENFPVGSMLVAKRLRPHVHAFYAFARVADDIADSPELEAEDKLARLDRMEAVLLGRAGTGSGTALGLRASLAETGVTDRHARDLLAAFRQDATKRRYASWGELLDYCRMSAMPVGRHVLDLHGEKRDTWAASDPLCAALQVLNHLQDCTGDLRSLDRCYLPTDLLDEVGATPMSVTDTHASPGLRRVLDRLLDQTDTLVMKGAGLPATVRDRRLRLETAVIAGLCRRLARRLRDGDPVAMRVKLTRADVAGSILGAFRWFA